MSILPPKNKKRIGIYGGSFDPIHHGHLILARDALEQLELDQLIFVPANVSPFKNRTVASPEMRLSMLRAAVKDEPNLAVDDCEVRRAPPSYSIDTVNEIRAREPNAELVWLIGEDHVDDLPKWHRFDELQRLVRFAVLARSGNEADHDYQIICRKIDISGTDIRKRVASGRPIRYLVPPAVEEIIRQGNLYREGAK
jgi:nicotinate-nucleotide adenylyltransferase